MARLNVGRQALPCMYVRIALLKAGRGGGPHFYFRTGPQIHFRVWFGV